MTESDINDAQARSERRVDALFAAVVLVIICTVCFTAGYLVRGWV